MKTYRPISGTTTQVPKLVVHPNMGQMMAWEQVRGPKAAAESGVFSDQDLCIEGSGLRE